MSPRVKGRLLGWLPELGVPAAYVIITLAMTYPAALHIGEQVLYSGRDGWIFWWNNWWIKRVLTTGGNAYLTKLLFFPQGVDLTYHSFSWLNTALWLLLEPLLGEVAAYNLTVLWVFPLAGWGMEQLVRDLTGSRGAAFVAGLVYAFVPYRMSHYNHGTLLGTRWLPLYSLFLLRAIRGGRRRDILLASLFLVPTALVGWNLFLYLIIWTGWIGCGAWLTRIGRVRRIAGVVVSVMMIGGVALSPLLVPMLTGGRFGGEDTAGNVEQVEITEGLVQTDLLAYLLPNRLHPLWGELVTPIYDQLVGQRRVVSLGYIVTALLVYGLARRNVRRQTWLWWGGVLLFGVMALGPFLRFGGRIYRSLPLPYYPLSKLYFFQLLKIPRRFNLVITLPVAVIVGYVVQDLLMRLGSRWRRGVLLALSMVILFEFCAAPLRMQPLQISPYYERLADEEGEFGIVELPIDFHGWSKMYMLYQTIHGRPIVEGHVSRRPAEAVAFLDANPLLHSLYQTQMVDPALTDVSRQLRTLRDAGFDYIIIHKQLIDVGYVLRWRDYLTILPLYEDDDLVVYTTAPRPGVDFALTPLPGYALGIVQATVMPETLHPGEALTVDLRWGATESPGSDLLVHVRLVGVSGQPNQEWTVSPVAGWPTSEWRAGDFGLAKHRLTLRPDLQPGQYTVTVALENPSDGTVGRPSEICVLQVAGE